MTKGQMQNVLHELRWVILRGDGTGLTDGQLLESYLAWRDEAAFETLLRRHGPMVLGVCRRVLRNEADAQDAFQATFLVFVRKAASIRPQAAVGNWLYGVARKTALKARAMNQQRRCKERQAMEMPRQAPAAAGRQELLARLDEVLSRLPDKYRAPIVLCDLEGKPLKEAAQHLGCPAGTVASRLARGRNLLARRLARYGPALSGGALALALAPAAGAVPFSLVVATRQAATAVAAGQAAAAGVISTEVAALTEGVVNAMLMVKWKVPAAVLLAVVLLGGGFATYRTRGAQPPETQPPVAEPTAEPPTPNKARPDKEQLQGAWVAVSGERNGAPLDALQLQNWGRLVFAGDQVSREGTEQRRGPFAIHPDQQPKAIDLFTDTFPMKAHYELTGTTLKLVLPLAERRATTRGSRGALLVVFAKQDKPKGSSPGAAKKDEKPKSDKEQLQGTWNVKSGEKNGEKLNEFQLKNWEQLIFADDKLTREGGEKREWTYKVDAAKKPKEIDILTADGQPLAVGIYELKGTTLKLAMALKERPSEFTSKGEGAFLFVFEKKK